MKNTQHYTQLLEEEALKLEKELQTVGRKNPERLSDWEAVEPDLNIDRADEDEVAEGIEEYEDNKGILNQLKKRLSEVQLALEAIKNNTYGVCTVCKEPIEEDRLEVNPAAQTCKKHM